MKKKFLILYAVCLAVSCPAWSQSIGPNTFNASGGSATLSGNTYEFSIGELVTTSLEGPGIVITQGVLQPNVQPTGIDEQHLTGEQMKLYPNPANNVVFLQPAFTHGGELSCDLYDALGRMIGRQTFTLSTGNEEQSISMQQLAAGSYLLEVGFVQNGKTIRGAYKVQKLQ